MTFLNESAFQIFQSKKNLQSQDWRKIECYVFVHFHHERVTLFNEIASPIVNGNLYFQQRLNKDACACV